METSTTSNLVRETRVTLNTAILAVRKGFNNFSDTDIVEHGQDGLCISIPTLERVQDWLRDEKNIHVYCTPIVDEILENKSKVNYQCQVVAKNAYRNVRGAYAYKTALELGIQRGLRLIRS